MKVFGVRSVVMPLKIADDLEPLATHFTTMRKLLIGGPMVTNVMFHHVAFVPERFFTEFAWRSDVWAFILQVIVDAQFNGNLFQFVIRDGGVGSES